MQKDKTCHNRKQKKLVSEPNYHTTMFFTEYLLEIEMIKTEIPIITNN